MRRTIALLLPVVIPSWRFFAAVGPSPRVEYALLQSKDDAATTWREYRPRPWHLPLIVMVRRLFYNPIWNESLFIMTCTERFLADGSQGARCTVLSHLLRDLTREGRASGASRYVRVRFIVVSRRDSRLIREEVYRSEPLSLEPGSCG